MFTVIDYLSGYWDVEVDAVDQALDVRLGFFVGGEGLFYLGGFDEQFCLAFFCGFWVFFVFFCEFCCQILGDCLIDF